MQAVILAAGLGKRLLPLTRHRSKAMVHLLGRPLIEWVLDTLPPDGIQELIIITGGEDHLIREYFASRKAGGRSIRFLVQEERLGMAHALHQAAEHIRGPFLLSACDSFISEDFVRRMLAEDADAVLALEDVRPEDVCRSASVRIEKGRITAIIEKPAPGEAFSSTVSLPLYRFPEAAARIAGEIRPSVRGEYEIQDVITALIARDARVVGIRTRERLQVSTVHDILKLSAPLLDRLASRLPPPPPGPVVHPPVLIGEDVVFGRDVEVGPYAVIENGCVLGDGVRVSNAVVTSGMVIETGAFIEHRIVL